jgi:MoaA/NifB/PqqE/SkfB family radical SAM enzyme
MSGVVAGSALVDYSSFATSLRLVALTINNSCNLSCPHCYLNYDGPNNEISTNLIDWVVEQNFEHLAIVGMEPFLNHKSTATTLIAARRATESAKTVSAITNGVGLQFLTPEDLHYFSYIDVSLDGGPRTYSSYRKASYDKVVRNISELRDHGLTVNVLNVLSDATIANIDDMMAIERDVDVSAIMFSPFMMSRNFKGNGVAPLSMTEIARRLNVSTAFLSGRASKLLVDEYHFDYDELTMQEFEEMARTLEFFPKLHIIPHTPLSLGTIRVTYDGFVMPPRAALHPRDYRSCGQPAMRASLEELYQMFLIEEALTIEQKNAA